MYIYIGHCALFLYLLSHFNLITSLEGTECIELSSLYCEESRAQRYEVTCKINKSWIQEWNPALLNMNMPFKQRTIRRYFIFHL